MSPQRINYRIIEGKAEMWSDCDDISWLVFLPGSEISETDLREISAMATRNHHPGELFNVLVDISALHMISHEARTFAAGTQHTGIYERLAIVAGTPAARLVGNFFIRFHKPPRPVRIFGDVYEAKQWLIKETGKKEKLGNLKGVAA